MSLWGPYKRYDLQCYLLIHLSSQSAEENTLSAMHWELSQKLTVLMYNHFKYWVCMQRPKKFYSNSLMGLRTYVKVMQQILILFFLCEMLWWRGGHVLEESLSQIIKFPSINLGQLYYSNKLENETGSEFTWLLEHMCTEFSSICWYNRKKRTANKENREKKDGLCFFTQPWYVLLSVVTLSFTDLRPSSITPCPCNLYTPLSRPPFKQIATETFAMIRSWYHSCVGNDR